MCFAILNRITKVDIQKSYPCKKESTLKGILLKEILVKFCNLIVNIDRSSLGYISDGRDHVCVFFSVEGNPLLERELYEGYGGV